MLKNYVESEIERVFQVHQISLVELQIILELETLRQRKYHYEE